MGMVYIHNASGIRPSASRYEPEPPSLQTGSVFIEGGSGPSKSLSTINGKDGLPAYSRGVAVDCQDGNGKTIVIHFVKNLETNKWGFYINKGTQANPRPVEITMTSSQIQAFYGQAMRISQNQLTNTVFGTNLQQMGEMWVTLEKMAGIKPEIRFQASPLNQYPDFVQYIQDHPIAGNKASIPPDLYVVSIPQELATAFTTIRVSSSNIRGQNEALAQNVFHAFADAQVRGKDATRAYQLIFNGLEGAFETQLNQSPEFSGRFIDQNHDQHYWFRMNDKYGGEANANDEELIMHSDFFLDEGHGLAQTPQISDSEGALKPDPSEAGKRPQFRLYVKLDRSQGKLLVVAVPIVR